MLTIFLLFFHLAQGAEGNSCPVTDSMLNQLKAYVLCQSSPSLAACAGLATGVAGRVVIRQPLESQIPALIEQNTQILTAELAEKIYDAEHSGSGIAFNQLAPAVQTFYLQQARHVILKLLQQSLLGQLDDYAIALILKTGVQFSKQLSSKAVTYHMKGLFLYVKDSVLNRSPMYSGRVVAPILTNSALTMGEALMVGQAAGQGEFILLSRLLGLGTLILGAVSDYFMMMGPTACAEYGDVYVNKDAQCRPVYEIDPHVLSFLNQPKEEQRQMLDVPSANVCGFYQKLHQKLFAQPRFVGLTCSSQGFDLTLDDDIIGANGKKKLRTLHARYRYRSTDIYQINMAHPNPLEIDEDGTIRGIEDYSSIAAEALLLKMYIMDAYDCCNTTDPELQKSCLAASNK